MRIAFAVMAVLCACASTAAAQTAQGSRPAVRGRAGGGVFTSNLDLEHRVYGPSLTGNEDITRRVTVLSGGLSVGRVGLGAEFAQLGEVNGSLLNSASIKATELAKESVLYGTANLRVVTGHTVGLELVGGAGVLRHRRETVTSQPTVPNSTSVKVENLKHPMFVAGVDLPIRLGANLQLAPTFRTWWLQRGRGTGVISNFGSHSFYSSSIRYLVGVTLSITF
ncbi:MAG: hypothetical protein KAY59_05295 [Acidobacteria bacterium]|nr:hypothetical protein [Acidobacteriota bacterium]MBP8273823.1 hypothetical protein [Acidobacteriota bacterium]